MTDTIEQNIEKNITSIDATVKNYIDTVIKDAKDDIILLVHEIDQETYTLWHRIVDEYKIGWPLWLPVVILAAVLGHVIH